MHQPLAVRAAAVLLPPGGHASHTGRRSHRWRSRRNQGRCLAVDRRGTVSDGGYVRAKAEGGTELRFSEGSTVALDPGTSTRVTDLDAHGSRVLLESGRAHVRVTHRPAAKWTVDAGPYSVQVVGTEFDVRWSGSEEVLDVQMQRGKIIVRGPLASGGLTMEAGQHLVANVKNGEIFLDATSGSETAAALPRARAESLRAAWDAEQP